MSDKLELYELTQALHRNGASTYQIGEALGCSAQTIRNALVDLGIERRRPLDQILDSLGADLKDRIAILQMQRRRQQEPDQSA